MKLSVIIPCYNAEDTISEQLEALAGQKWCELWEVIVVNNRSTDNSMAVVAKFQEKIPNLRVVDAFDRQGQPYALSTGIKAAQGDAVAFCDADDIVSPNWVSAMGDALSEHDFVACRMDTETLNADWLQQSRGNSQLTELPKIWYPPFMLHAGGGTLGIRRSICEKIGDFDDLLPCLHDTDYCFRIQANGTPFHFVPEAVMKIRFRVSLLDIYRQARNYAKYNVLLAKRYRPVEQKSLKDKLRPWKRTVTKWIRQVMMLPMLRSKKSRGKWVWTLGWQVGRIQGAIKYRTIPV